jgi:citronellol/citronellal dehydrogenase
VKRFDLLQQINMRGTFLASRACAAHLRKSANPHILTLSPPLNLRPEWFGQHLPYTLSKYGMSMVMLGLAEEFRSAGIACNTLWPRTTIATAAVKYALGGDEMINRSRTPEIMADAAYAIFNKPAREYTGRFLMDDEVLAGEGVTDLTKYSVVQGSRLQIDIFVESGPPST